MQTLRAWPLLRALGGAAATATTFHAAAAVPDLTVYDGRPGAGWHVTVAHSEGQARLEGSAVTVPVNPKQPEAVVQASAAKAGRRDALVLKFHDTWYASLRLEGGQRDLRPYAPDGVLAFDLDVREMSKGGIYFQLGCGTDCERKVPYVLQSRAAAGKGWRHLEFPMRCFLRDGDDFSAVARPFSIEANGAGEVAVANVRFKARGKPNAACPDYRTVSVTPEPLDEPWSLDWWMPRHAQKLREIAARKAEGTLPELVFIGDSITQGWEKEGKEEWERRYARHHALNLGYSGDRTENILWRLRHGEVDGLDPKVVVLMAGTNNTGHRQEDPRTTAAGLKQIVDELRRRMPRTRVLVLGIFPRDAAPDARQRRINNDVNAILATYADDRQVFYHDVSAAFLDAQGRLPTDVMPDLLHPNARGYALWAEAMAPVLQRLLGGYEWNSVAIGGGGFVTAVVPSPSEQGVAYARTDVGGAYRWDGKRARWQALQDWVAEDQTGLLGVDALAVDPHDAARVYLLAGTAYLNGGRTAILRSSDYGKTFAVTDVTAQFKTHGNGMGRENGERLAVDPANGNTLYAGTRADGLFRSLDAGATWQRLPGLDVTATPNGVGIVFVVPDAGRLYVGVSRYGSVGPNLYRSDDGGATFVPVAGTPRDLMPHRAAPDGQGNLYVTFANGAGPHPDKAGREPVDRGGVWKYAGTARAWTEVTPPGMRTAFSGISVDRNDPRRVLVSTINTFLPQVDASAPAEGAKGDRIFLSQDGGASWVDVVGRGFAKDTAGIDWIRGHGIHWAGSVAFDPFDGRAAWVTSGNGVFHTAAIDAVPATWRFAVDGMEETVPLNMASVPGGPMISVVGDVDGFVHRDPARYSPTHQPRMGTTFGLALAGSRPAVLARAGARIYTSADGGATWQAAPVTKGRNGQLALSADGAVLLHSPAGSVLTWRTTDAGKTWTEVAGLAGDARPVGDPVDPARFYAYQDGAFLVSTDAGRSFAPAARLPAGGSNVVGAMPGRAGDLWVALKDGGLARSVDGGRTFRPLAGVEHGGAVGFGKAAPGATDPAVYIWGTVKGQRGVHRSLDAGASWTRINDDAHQYGGPGDGRFIVGDLNVFGRVYMSTAGRGIVYGQPAGMP